MVSRRVDYTSGVHIKRIIHAHRTHWDRSGKTTFHPVALGKHNKILLRWKFSRPQGGETAGETIPIARFYIARPHVDTSDTINAQLGQGKNLILTPGIWELTSPIHVTRPHTLVLGLGFCDTTPCNQQSDCDSSMSGAHRSDKKDIRGESDSDDPLPGGSFAPTAMD
jgi:hypothetical protein